MEEGGESIMSFTTYHWIGSHLFKSILCNIPVPTCTMKRLMVTVTVPPVYTEIPSKCNFNRNNDRNPLSSFCTETHSKSRLKHNIRQL